MHGSSYPVVYTDNAKASLAELLDFWEAVHGKVKSIEYMLALQHHLDFLSRNPFAGRLLERHPHELRQYVAHPTYSIIHEWQAASQTVKVLAFWDNRRNPEHLRV